MSSQQGAPDTERWARVADGWLKWWDVLERGGQAVSDRLCEVAEVRAGQAVLDVATGLGEPAMTAARIVGAQGRVVASDASAAMLEHARQRAQRAGYAHVQTRQMDAAAPDLPDASFDAVLSRWGLMFLSDPSLGVVRLAGLLRPGGSLAVAVWSTPERVPMISVPAATARKVLGAPAPPGGPPQFGLARPALLVGAFERAGLRDVRHEEVVAHTTFASVDAFVEWTSDLSATIGELLVGRPASDVERVHAAIRTAAARHTAPDGTVSFDNVSLLVWGKRGPTP